jgi:hypothetical protein
MFNGIKGTALRPGPSFILAILLTAVLLAVPTVGVAEVSHTNYDDAQVNLLVFCNLLNTSVQQVNGYLSNSNLQLDSDGEVDDEEMRASFITNREEIINLPIERAYWNHTQLNRTLSDAKRTKDEILDLAESGQYLEDIITPYFHLKENLSLHCELHEHLLEDLSNLVGIYFDSDQITDTQMAESIGNITHAAMDLEELRTFHQALETNIQALESVTVEGEDLDLCGVEDIETNLDELEALYDYYEDLIDFFSYRLVLEEPMLILELEKDRYYLKEEMKGSGYFLTGGPLESSQVINILMEDRPLYSTNTDTRGYFTFSFDVPLDACLGIVNISANVSFESQLFQSKPLVVLIEKIPLRLEMILSGQDLSQDEVLEISVEVRDHYYDSISSGLVHINVSSEESVSLTTSRDGMFVHKVDLDGYNYGYYSVEARFPETAQYQATEVLDFFRVNIETIIEIEAESTEVKVGEELDFIGIFRTGEGEDLDGYELVLYKDGSAQNVITTQDGQFQTSVTFQQAGTYRLQVTFVSQDPRLRNSTSEELLITVEAPIEDEGPFLSLWIWLVILAIIIIVVLIAVVMTVFRRGKKREVSKPPPTRPEDKEPSKKEKEIPRPSEHLVQTALDRVEMLDIEFMSSEQESVVVHYRIFLEHVVRSTGLDISSMTPNEIRNAAIGSGMSSVPVRTVTNIFNKAFYAETKVTTRDMESMAEGIERILGGGRG